MDTAFAIVDWHTEALAAIEATLTRIDRTKAAHPDFAKAMKALVRRQITERLRQSSRLGQRTHGRHIPCRKR